MLYWKYLYLPFHTVLIPSMYTDVIGLLHPKSLKTNGGLLYLKTQFVPRSEHFSSRLQKPISLRLSGKSRCLFSDKYKTYKYSVGRTYNC